MSDAVKAGESRPEVGFGELMLFLKKRWKGVVFFGVVSALITVLLIGFGYFLLPCQEIYSLRLSLQLQKTGDGRFIYPSTKAFSAPDIISTVVLRRVYDANKLSSRISFDDFSKLFYLSENDKEKAALAASYRGKFAKKTISIVELKELEAEYASALEKLGHQFVEISMGSSLKISDRREITRILQSVPTTWFDIYSKLEAKTLPQMESEAQVRDLRNGLAVDGWLITLDKARIVCSRLQSVCEELNRMLMGQKVALPSGEFLETLQFRLEDLEKRRIRPLLMLVLSNPSYSKNPINNAFLRSNIMNLERKINEQQARYDGAVEAINVLYQRNSAGGVNKMTAQQPEQGAPLTLNLDSNFMMTLSSLIRSAQSMEMRRQYAAAAFKIQENIAKLNADKTQYEEMLRILGQEKPAVVQLTPEQFGKLEKKMFDELTLLCGKVNEFREIVTKDYLTSRQFFTTTGEVQKNVCFYFPFKYFAILLVFLLVVANVIFVGNRFFAALAAGELKK